MSDFDRDDLISRQAAIDAADRTDYTGLSVEDVKKVTDEVIKELKQLPSAVEAIPVVWIEEYIKRVLSFDGYYSSLRALFIHIMLNDWRKEQK